MGEPDTATWGRAEAPIAGVPQGDPRARHRRLIAPTLSNVAVAGLPCGDELGSATTARSRPCGPAVRWSSRRPDVLLPTAGECSAGEPMRQRGGTG